MKVVINTETGKSYQRELEDPSPLYGLKIGDEFDGGIVGLPGYRLKIMGGTDKNGFPMRPRLPGTKRKRLLVVVNHKTGVRRRKTYRGNTIAEDIAQVNAKIVKKGPKSIEDLFGLEGGQEEAAGESQE